MTNDRKISEHQEVPIWKLMIAKWAALVPALLIVDYTIKWLPPDPVLWLKLLISASIIVPLMEYVLSPMVKKLLSDWLYMSPS